MVQRLLRTRARVWSRTDGELTLPSFVFAAGRDPLDARTLEAIALGIDGGKDSKRRWRDGSMIVRWIAAGIFEAQRRFRRIRGHQDLETLCSAIERHAKKETLDPENRIA